MCLPPVDLRAVCLVRAILCELICRLGLGNLEEIDGGGLGSRRM